MAFFTDLARHVDALRDALGCDVEAAGLPGAVAGLADDAVVSVIAAATAVVRAAEKVRITASGVAAARSTREHGQAGLAQTRGHRSSVSLVQEITGSSRADAVKHVRLGESLLAGTAEGPDAAGAAGGPEAAAPPARLEPWHAPLGRALLAGAITSAQHDVILRGLGEPPAVDAGDVTCDCGGGDPAAACGCAAAAVAAVREVWSLAAEQLIAEARERTVEELARTARTVRDQLDPEGAEHRFDDRFARRSFRLWTDADGVRRASMVFDDHGGEWAQTILATALRPRRGGPRFVDPDEKRQAEDLVADPRTNEQLAYDLVIDVLRAGALADAKSVFGTRQAGVRVVITADDLTASTHDDRPAVGLVEDGQAALPVWLIGQQACETGTVDCTVDRDGNPLRLGREQRLFTPRQRLALAVRDGGCRWKGCDRPPSYCEAHHIDHYARDHGRTDVERGILLCRFHHMQLHHADRHGGGWRITRERLGDFVLHPPGGGEAIVLKPRLTLAYTWAGIDPPPRRFRAAGSSSVA